MSRERKPKLLKLAVTFGSVTIGRQSVRISCSLERRLLSLTDASDLLCEKRISGSLESRNGDDEPGQKTLVDDSYKVADVYDIKRFGVSATDYTFGCVFALDGLQLDVLAKLACRPGCMSLDSVGAIPDDSKDEEDE